MNWGDFVVNAIGWIGTALVILSLAQARAIRLHVLNLSAALILVGYNALIGALPGIGLNAALVLVNAWRLWRLSVARATRTADAVSPPGDGAQ
jgi:hypothetical protein